MACGGVAGAGPAGGAGGWKGLELPLEAAPALGLEAPPRPIGPEAVAPRSGALPPAGEGGRGAGTGQAAAGAVSLSLSFPLRPARWRQGAAAAARGRYRGLESGGGAGAPAAPAAPKFAQRAGLAPPGTCRGRPRGSQGAPSGAEVGVASRSQELRGRALRSGAERGVSANPDRGGASCSAQLRPGEAARRPEAQAFAPAEQAGRLVLGPPRAVATRFCPGRGKGSSCPCRVPARAGFL